MGWILFCVWLQKKLDVISKKAGKRQLINGVQLELESLIYLLVQKESAGTVIYIKLKDDEVSEFVSKYRIKKYSWKYSNHIVYQFSKLWRRSYSKLSEEDKKLEKKQLKNLRENMKSNKCSNKDFGLKQNLN